MRICPSCSTENPDDRDFCSSCNTYLRWEPTQYSPSVPSVAQTPAAPAPPSAPDDAPTQADPPPAQPEQGRHAMQQLPVIKPEGTRQYEAAPSNAQAPTAAPPPPPEPPPTEPDTVIVTLRLPGEEGAGSASVSTSVAPGMQTILLALVRNQSGIVDNYDLVIDGMPEDWWTITPSTVYLVPFGAPGGEYEQEVEVRFHPPRSPEAEARPWQVRIVATSKAHERPVGSASANVVIEPYQELETEMRPERANGHRKAKFAIAVRNRANAPTDVAFAAVDSENQCEFQFDEPGVSVPPGKRLGTPFIAKPRKTHWFGRPIERRFQVSADPAGAEQPSIPRQGVFRHKPWIAWWVPIVVPILAAIGIAIWLLWPHNTIVPNLKGMKVFAAQQLLAKKGLELGQTTDGPQTSDPHLIGLIKDQSRKPGTKVKKGTKIDVVKWTSSQTVRVPDLTGKTLSQATVELDKLHLASATIPNPQNPDQDTVKNENPPAGTTVKEATTITLFLTIGGKGKGKNNNKNNNNNAKKNAPKVLKAVGGQFVIPALAGQAFTGKGIASLTKLGFPIQQTPVISAAALGTIVGTQTPKPGTKIDPKQIDPKKFPVSVSVSIGFPKIAYDTAGNLVEAQGNDGKQSTPIAAGIEPSWQPHGRLIAYQTGEQKIFTYDTATRVNSLPLAQGDVRRPVFSPDGKTIAFISAFGTGDGQLCLVSSAGGAAQCLPPDTTASLNRPMWSPDGKAILAVAYQPAQNAPATVPIGVYLYTSARASSASPVDWTRRGLLLRGQFTYVALPPALVKPLSAALVTQAGQLFLAPWALTTHTLGQQKQITTNTSICTAAWRPDGQELAVTICAGGEVDRLSPAKPNSPVRLAPGPAEDPAWQFVDLTPH